MEIDAEDIDGARFALVGDEEVFLCEVGYRVIGCISDADFDLDDAGFGVESGHWWLSLRAWGEG
jgi:RimJ/RimL family protein N-acetyltransferase